MHLLSFHAQMTPLAEDDRSETTHSSLCAPLSTSAWAAAFTPRKV